jgi:hypothetical protein
MRTLVQTVFLFALAMLLCHAGVDAQGLEEQRYSRPALFTENAGQWDEAVRFRSFGASHTLLFTKHGLVAVRRDAGVHAGMPDRERLPVNPYPSISFVNPSSAMHAEGSAEAAARFNYYRGTDTTRWRTDVRTYRGVRYEEVWKDIDVSYTIAHGVLRQTIDVGPDGDACDVRFTADGDGIGLRLLGAVTEDGRSIAAELVEMNGVYDMRTLSAGSTQHWYFRTEYSFDFGGERDDVVKSICVDRDGNVVTVGITESGHFPVRNNQYTDMDYSDYFLAKFDCNGNMVYGTYLGGSGIDTDIAVVLRRDNGIVMAGSMSTLGLDAFPITKNAFDTTRNVNYPCVIARITADGTLQYASYLLPAYHGVKIAIDNNDCVYLGATESDMRYVDYTDRKYVTHGVIHKHGPAPGYIDGMIIKMNQYCDSVLFGTHVCGDSSSAHLSAIGVGPDGCPVVVGVGSGRDFPATKHYSPDNVGGPSGAFVMKINTNGTKYVYCTTYRGSLNDSGLGIYPAVSDLAFDASGNINIVGAVSAWDMPLMHPLRASRCGNRDGFISTFDTAGILLYNTYTGGAGTDYNVGISLDECGNRFVLSSYGGGIGVYGPIDTSLNTVISTQYLTVIDADGDSVVLSTPWGAGEFASTNINAQNRNIIYDDNGYIYLGGTSLGIPIVNARDTSITGEQKDAFLTRLFLPFCNQDYVHCELALPRELRYEQSRRVAMPSSFPVTVTVRNTRSDRPALDVAVELSLPAGLVLDPPAQSLVQQLTPSMLSPDSSRRLTWSVRVDTALYGDSSVPISAVAVFRNPLARSQCPLPFSRSDSAVPIRFETIPAPEVTCALSAPDTLQADASGRRYAENPFTVDVHVTNDGSVPVSLRRVSLRLPVGMGLSTVPPNDTVRLLPALSPRETRTVSWQVTAGGSPVWRAARILAALVDTFGVDASSCERVLAIASLTSLECALRSTDTVRYDTTASAYVPSPFPLTVDLRRTVDTVVLGVEAEVDLSSAPHLRLAAGDTLRKTLGAIYSHETFSLAWMLEVVPPVPWPCTETIAVRYRAQGWSGWERCERSIALVPPPALVSCRLTIPAVADSQGVYTPDPIPVEYELHNGGAGPLQPRTATLTVTPPIATLLDASQRALTDRAPGSDTTLLWRLQAPTSRFARAASLLAVTRDSLGSELTRCGATLVLPPIIPDLRCTLGAPDTLHYDIASDTYSPDPFTASLMLANVLDTAQSAIEAEMDLSSAPHLALDAGEAAAKSLDSIPVHGSAGLDWRLTVAQRLDSAVMERIAVRFRHAGDTAWMRCERDVVIQGGKRIIAASCLAAGHDTLWADVAYEDVIPHPVQVQYTIRNTGTVPLEACSAAIVHPPALRLVNPADSIRDYGRIAPGASVAREWLLEVNQASAQAGDHLLSWVRSCSNLSGDTACTKRVTLALGSPRGIVLSPWLLRFQAERHAPLPAAQTVTLWTGGALAMPWQLQPFASWLDVQPLMGSKMQAVSVQPNTTDMQDGVYEAIIDMASAAMISPPRIDVIYEIGMISGTDATEVLPVGIVLEAPYPNPAQSAISVAFSIATAGGAQLALYDIYGRRVMLLAEGDFAPGRHTVRAELSALPAGVYVCVLNAGSGCAARRMLLRK